MKIRFLFFSVLVLALLSSCNSFNHVVVQQYPIPPDKSDYQEWLETTPLPAGVEFSCPTYVPPVFAKTPEVPLKELKKISPLDGEALDRLHQKHIEDLRLYIVKIKAQTAAAQKEYFDKCRKLHKK